MNETKAPPERSAPTPYEYHKKAFSSLCHYIDSEIIQTKNAVLVAFLLSKYKEEYRCNGGDPETVSNYTSQNLMRKIQDRYADKVRVKLADHRKGNYICSSTLTDEEAKSQIFGDGKEQQENEKLKWAALHLRFLIMQLPKSKTPDPATVQNLKESAAGPVL